MSLNSNNKDDLLGILASLAYVIHTKELPIDWETRTKMFDICFNAYCLAETREADDAERMEAVARVASLIGLLTNGELVLPVAADDSDE